MDRRGKNRRQGAFSCLPQMGAQEVTNPADSPDPRVQAKHFRGAYLAVKAENDRLTIEVANLRRKLQLQNNAAPAKERVWSDAIDGRK